MSNGNNIGDPNADTGRELANFFIDLLKSGQDLNDYTTPDARRDVIGRKDLSDYARELLENGSLREIEENIAKVEGSRARPLLIVWPPM